MEKKIRKALLEVKERKEIILIEQEIVKSRILTIIESVNTTDVFENLPQGKKLYLSFQIMRELAYLQENSLLNEGFLDTLKGLFGGFFSAGPVIETIAEPILNMIFTKIGFKSNSFLKKFMISFLTSRPSELIQAFTDCKMAVKLLTESFIEAIVMMLQQHFEVGGLLSDWLRNSLAGQIKETSVVSAMEEKIESTVCDLFSNFSDKAEAVADKLKATQTPVKTDGGETAKASTGGGIIDKIKGFF